MEKTKSRQARDIPRASRVEETGAEGPRNGGPPTPPPTLRRAQTPATDPVAKARAIRSTAPVRVAVQPQFRHPPAGSALLSEEAWAETAHAFHLSGRELEVVRGVFDNCKETALAADLGIAPCTVHTHMERLFHKLGVTTRVELVLRVVETCLLERSGDAAPPVG